MTASLCDASRERLTEPLPQNTGNLASHISLARIASSYLSGFSSLPARRWSWDWYRYRYTRVPDNNSGDDTRDKDEGGMTNIDARLICSHRKHLEARGSVPSIKKRAAAGVRFRFVRVAAVDARIDVLADEVLQRSAAGRFGVNVKVLAAVRIRAGWNKPLRRPDKIDIWVLIGRRGETQIIQLHERIAFKGKLDAGGRALLRF